jgi:hypothetical protein
MEEPEDSTKPSAQPEPVAGQKQKKSRRPLYNILGGGYLSKESVMGNLIYIIFVAILGLVYISNNFYAEKTAREIEKTKRELKELRYKYVVTKAALMYKSKLSEISEKAAKLGLKESVIPPYKIFYSSDSTTEIKK